MSGFLSTEDLEKHIRSEYAKIELPAKKDGVFKPLRTFFSNGTPNGRPGSFCYSDEEGYHFGSIEIRGELQRVVTQSLFDITYQALNDDIFWMSFEYGRKNKVEGQDSRRVLFDKNIQYWSIIGDDYAELERQKNDETLKKHPFVD